MRTRAGVRRRPRSAAGIHLKTQTLVGSPVERLDAETVDRTLGSVLKYSDDQEVIRAAGLEQLVSGGD